MVNEHILVVCTANMCRSPMAAALLQAAVEAEGIAVSSAGFMQEGRQVPQEVLKVMGKRGLDLNHHLSSHVQGALVPAPDLIITMSRQHIRSLAGVAQELIPRTFTLKEFVRRAGAAPHRGPGETLGAYAERLSRGRQLRSLATGGEEDVEDPIGKRLPAYERCARELQDLTEQAAIFLISPPAGGKKSYSALD